MSSVADVDDFAFVMNVLSLDASSYELAPGCVLRRASQLEIAAIKKMLEGANAFGLVADFELHGLPWEKKLFAAPGPIKLLPKEEWRYFVIGFQGTNEEIENVALSSCLASTELEIGFTLLRLDPQREKPTGIVWHPARLFHGLEVVRNQDNFFCRVTSADIEEIRAINLQLKLADAHIRNLVSQLQILKGLPHDSPLRFLGYFALLESVLTHTPKPEDPYDSITRQVKKKLALLDARWQRKIDYSAFLDAKTEKVWSKMYEYRSAVAHGGTPDFDGALRPLKGPVEALDLVKETVKAVLRQTLIEPQLLRDLREC